MKRPARISGSAVMASMTVRTMLAKRPPTSERYTAVARPSGSEMAMAMAISIRVPTIAWRIPPCESGAVGLIADMSWVRKRTLVNACHPLTKVKMTALARAATTITDAISSVAVTRRSMTIGRGLDTDTTTA